MLNQTITILFLLFSTALLAQPNGGSIQTVANNDAITLVKDIFIKGSCKNVRNIEASGVSESFGEFTNGGNVIGLPEGILLSSGDVRLAEGPNNSVETSARFNRSSQDKDLIEIATNQLFDVTVLEFDFVPIADEVTFQYVFASEEYCEFVGTIFNDVFGFFVSGPGINGPFADGAINVARLPDSGDFVSINSVNHELNQDSYVKNELQEDANNCMVPFNPNHINTIEYDGFTIPLIARFSVIPCETYHIRLVVGDVGDDKLDSAVFLRAQSFDLGDLPSIEAIIPNRTDTTAYENCLDGQFVFTRPPGSGRSQPVTVDFEIDNTSTATENLDFQPIPRNITIPAGQNSFVLPIQSLVDDEIEDLETLTLNLLQICDCEEGSRATLNLSDAKAPEIDFPTLAACADQAFTLRPNVSDGVPPLNYTWNNGATADSLLLELQTATTFSLSITDFCNNQATDSTQITIQATPTAALSGAIDYCIGLENVGLPLTFNGNPPWSFSYSINSNPLQTIDAIFDENFTLPVSAIGTYELVAFRDAACVGLAEGNGVVNDINIAVAIEAVGPTCPNGEDGEIRLSVMDAAAPFTIDWSVPTNTPTNPSNLMAGNYDLTIVDAENCLFTASVNLPNPTSIPAICENNAVYIPNVFSPNGDGINDIFEVFLANETTVRQILRTEIIDRWGNLVYFSENGVPLWDGQFKGEPLPPAVFMYKIQVELTNGEIEWLQGSLSLVR